MKETLIRDFMAETEHKSMELSDIIDHYLEKIKKTDDPNKTIIQHRKLHRELTNELSKLNKEEFSYGLFCHQIIGSTINDLYEIYQVDPLIARDIINTLNDSLGSLSQALRSSGKEKHNFLDKWLENFITFGNFYKDLTFKRDTGDYDYVEANGFIISFSMDNDNLLGIPEEDDYKIFPNLDRNISDANRSKQVADMYKNAIEDLKEKYNINSLCFIEKPYSAIGALTLLSQLVNDFKLPATVYRNGNWDINTRISGKKPDDESNYCIVYDLAIGGGGIIEASTFLNENYGSKVSGAVVFFDYEKRNGAKYALGKKNIELISLLKMSKVRAEIDSQMSYFKKLNEIQRQFELGKFNAGVTREKIGNALKKYSASLK